MASNSCARRRNCPSCSPWPTTNTHPRERRKSYITLAARDAPWIWYEPVDIDRVPTNRSHGTDMFEVHPELPGIILDWFVTTLNKTPGHAPADTVASAPILNQIRMPAESPKSRSG
jgi:hypothetical protein